MKNWKGISSFTLRMMAMGFMLCDHLWATVIPGNDWLTWLGRLTFPIFAFLTVEGYYHTHDLKKYLRRMILWAVITEIPFNLMYAGSWIYPFQQNVLWTFVLSLLCMQGVEKQKQRSNPMLKWGITLLLVIVYYLAGTLLMVDYSGYGILMVLVFYFFRGNNWQMRLFQLLALLYINCGMIKGLNVPIEFCNLSLEIPRQGMAVLALLPIWCYQGRQGPHSKILQTCWYAFYPVHMLILALLVKMM